jgi:hypothetical protein
LLKFAIVALDSPAYFCYHGTMMISKRARDLTYEDMNKEAEFWGTKWKTSILPLAYDPDLHELVYVGEKDPELEARGAYEPYRYRIAIRGILFKRFGTVNLNSGSQHHILGPDMIVDLF